MEHHYHQQKDSLEVNEEVGIPWVYFEGVSGKLASTDPDGNGFFMFEDTFAVGAVELMRLGFTAQQIQEAR